MTDFQTISVELPSGRALEAQRETRHSVWLEGWELAEVGDVVRIEGAPWRVEDVQRARIGGQRASRLRVVLARTSAEAPESATEGSETGRSGASGLTPRPSRLEGNSSDARSEPASDERDPITDRELDRRLGAALGGASEGEELRYASELGALLRLTAHMERLGYRLSYTPVGDAPVVARVEPVDGSRRALEATGPTVAEALCRVSLEALERWEGAGPEEELRPPPRGPTRRPTREVDPSSGRRDSSEAVERG